MISHLIAFVFLIVFPLCSGWQYMRARQRNHTKEKLKLYVLVMVLLWSAALAIMMIMPMEYIFKYPYDFTLPTYIHIIFYILLLYFLISQIVPLLFVWLKNQTFLSRLNETSTWNRSANPQNDHERRVFMLLACSVGICEEIMFRAFLPHYLQQEPYTLSLIVSMFVASVIFALIHFHQGTMGMIQALFIGFMFNYLFILSGSLWLPIVLHIIYDMKVVLISKRIEEASNLQLQDRS